MSSRMDTGIYDYALNVPVVSGVPYVGLPVALYGAMGFSVHCVLTNGAAGTSVCQVTNFGQDLVPPGGIPWSQLSSDTLAANAMKYNGYSASQVGEAFARFARFVFTPSASGNLYYAVNVRRLSA